MSYPRHYGPYTLLERLGHGGMSEVDLARQAVADAGYVRLLVIKRLRPNIAAQPHYVRMFQDEARINTELQHANIVQIYNFGHIRDEYYLAMEYIAGTDLRALQRCAAARDEALPLRLTLRVIADVLAALDYAHSRVDTFGRPMNVVHRDVNPRNIMLSVRGEVKLIDFGVAKADNRPEETVSHALKGKFAYMSPEQIEGSRRIDGRSDVYAMGLILHELLNGRSPFAGLTDIQTMHRILAGKIPELAIPDGYPTPERLVALHQQALATDPDLRYPDAATMRRAVLSAAEPLGGLATNAQLADAVLRLMPDTDRDRLDRLDQYREAGHPLEPSAHTDEIAPTITDVDLSPRLPEYPTTTTVNTQPSVLTEARSASWPILIGMSLGVAILASVGGAIYATDQLLLSDRAPIDIPTPPEAAPEPTPTPAPAPEPAPEPIEEPTEEPTADPDPVADPVVPEPTPIKVRIPPTPEPAPDTTPAAAPAPEPEPETTSEPTEFGFLYVTTTGTHGHPVFVNGAQVGVTPVRGHKLPVGAYTIETVHPDTGERLKQKATIVQGRPAPVTFSL